MQNNPEIKKILWSSLAHKIRSTPPHPPWISMFPRIDGEFYQDPSQWWQVFEKVGFIFFVQRSWQNLDPWQIICCLSGQLNPPLGFTKHKISERKTKCKEESRSMLAWTICCAIVSWKLITNCHIPLETIVTLRKHKVSWTVTYEYPILLQ